MKNKRVRNIFFLSNLPALGPILYYFFFLMINDQGIMGILVFITLPMIVMSAMYGLLAYGILYLLVEKWQLWNKLKKFNVIVAYILGGILAIFYAILSFGVAAMGIYNASALALGLAWYIN